jgi:predicted nucleotidyltransferase
MILLNMGTRKTRRPASLADALFTPVQQRVLGLLFGQPQRRFQSAEIIRLAKGGTGAVHRQLARLADAGLVTVTQIGNQKHYQARRDSPIFTELHRLVIKTVAIVEPLRRALAKHESEIHAAFVYGSVAKNTDVAGSDIDLMILSDSLDHSELYAVLQPAESALARAINPTVMTPRTWRAKLADPDSFVRRIASGPRLLVTGSDDRLV